MKKRGLVSFIIILIVIGAALSACNSTIQKQQELKQEELKLAYDTQNSIFNDVLDASFGERDKYMPVNVRTPNPEGISFGTYIGLTCFRKDTGNDLTYDQVIDYFSKEFEDDGEIRIYNNGKHPEIAAYIEWGTENEKTWSKYESAIMGIWSAYTWEHREFKTCLLSLIPTEMVDELIKKEADPNYELDLMSIQQKWLDEGRAKVLDNGYQIEYFSEDVS